MDTIGLDGATMIDSAEARASSTPGEGRDSSAPANRTAATGTEWACRTK
jgi:hypothetical protein